MTDNKDVEKQVKDDIPYAHGFRGLSELLNLDPDRFLMIFNRFDDLAMRNLVYMQSELADLERRLEKIDAEDEAMRDRPELKAGQKQRECMTSWAKIEEYGTVPVDAIPGARKTREQKRLELIRRIRVTMKEYRDAMLQQAQLNNLDSPGDKSVESIRQVFKVKGVNHFIDQADVMYETSRDVVSLRSPVVSDAFASIIDSSKILRHGIKQNERHAGLTLYSQDDVIARANKFYVTLALIMIVIPIFVLYAISRYVTPKAAPWIGLGITVLATAVFLVFSQTLAMGRSELFGTTASYLSVLLVFVALTLTPSNG